MSKYFVLKENRDFSRLYRQGKSFVSPVLVTYVLKRRQRDGATRIGITTGKKVGNAVKRSRARRVIRASYYQLYPQVKQGYDIVFVARTKTAFVKSQAVQRAMTSHLQQAKVLQAPGHESNEKKM